jgi:hypothetical protein
MKPFTSFFTLFFFFFPVLTVGKRKNSLEYLTGFYRAIDIDDGSLQSLAVLCTKQYCDFTQTDTGYRTCQFLNGVGIASGITDISEFFVELFCATDESGGIVDTSGEPSAMLDFGMEIVEEGIIRRKATGYTYYKVSEE